QFEFFLEVGECATHEPLDAEDGVFRVGERPLLRGAPDEHTSVVMKGDATRYERGAAFVAHDDRAPVLDERGEAEGGSQIDPDDLRSGHWCSDEARKRALQDLNL